MSRSEVDDNVIVGQTASNLARRIAAGELSSRDVVQAHIQRIEEVNPTLNAVVVPRFDVALELAGRADEAQARGKPLGPLHGVPVTIKEMFDFVGTPTTAGLTSWAKRIAKADATCVARLKQSGAIILGKTNVPQLGMKVASENPVYGVTKNPWNAERTPGGSTGGEAAIIAAGGSPLGLGSDGGGSIRQPCHSCGIAGFKPTGRRLSFRGHWSVPLWTADWLQPGPMARSVEDLWLALKVLGTDASGQPEFEENRARIQDYREIDPGKLRVGYYTQLGWLTPCRAAERAVLEAVSFLQSEGVHVEPFEPPDVHDAMRLYFSIFYADAMQFMKRDLRGSIVDKDVRQYLALARIPTFLRPLISAAYGWAGQRAMSQSLHYLRKRVLSAPEYLQLLAEQHEYRNRFVGAMDAARLDALICPPSPLPAIRHGEFYANFSLIFTSLYNLLAMPAGVVPATRVQQGEESGPAAIAIASSAASRESSEAVSACPLASRSCRAGGGKKWPSPSCISWNAISARTTVARFWQQRTLSRPEIVHRNKPDEQVVAESQEFRPLSRTPEFLRISYGHTMRRSRQVCS